MKYVQLNTSFNYVRNFLFFKIKNIFTNTWTIITIKHNGDKPSLQSKKFCFRCKKPGTYRIVVFSFKISGILDVIINCWSWSLTLDRHKINHDLKISYNNVRTIKIQSSTYTYTYCFSKSLPLKISVQCSISFTNDSSIFYVSTVKTAVNSHNS